MIPANTIVGPGHMSWLCAAASSQLNPKGGALDLHAAYGAGRCATQKQAMQSLASTNS